MYFIGSWSNKKDYQMLIVSRDFNLCKSWLESSVTLKQELYDSNELKKNVLSILWSKVSEFLWSQSTTCKRPFLWWYKNLSWFGSPSCKMPGMSEGDSRSIRLSCWQSVLHQTVCDVCRQTLPYIDHQRHCQRTTPKLENCQRPWETVYARTTP